ncbi:MAG: bifunctional diaminohydroxyphosphoribosylaminopyrimidine deaminase/5-amino-6-(5-phosphoribosylamino)uracil reductase RibD, partial [Fidelibacterota bacterium]
MQNIDDHRNYMLQAMALSTQGVDRVSPNPYVGCLIVENNKIIADGFHHVAGGVHAEVDALNSVDRITSDAVIYVTVEPCSIFGKTPPCVDRIVHSGINNVVVGMTDPNPDVNGRGIEELKKQGIHVHSGVLEKEIRHLNRGFIKRIETGYPWVILKLAQSSDGFISGSGKVRTQISGELSRRFTHKLRSDCDAVLIGRTTAFVDNPQLTVRYADGKNPIRFIADSNDRLPKSLNIFRDQKAKTVVLVSQKKMKTHRTSFCQYIAVKEKGNKMCPKDILKKISTFGVTSLLIEGGAELAESFLSEDLVDEMVLIIKNVWRGV